MPRVKKKSIWKFESREEMLREKNNLWKKIQSDPNWKRVYDILGEL